MTPEAWGFFSLLTTTGAGTLVELVRTRRKVERSANASAAAAKQAAAAASEAADLARPMGNGYAARTESALHEIVTQVRDLTPRLDRIESKIDSHIADHAANDVRRHREAKT